VKPRLVSEKKYIICEDERRSVLIDISAFMVT
jgi:hypothetical protein